MTNLYGELYDIIAYSEPQQVAERVENLLANYDFSLFKKEQVRSNLYDWVAYESPVNALKKMYEVLSSQ